MNRGRNIQGWWNFKRMWRNKHLFSSNKEANLQTYHLGLRKLISKWNKPFQQNSVSCYDYTSLKLSVYHCAFSDTFFLLKEGNFTILRGHLCPWPICHYIFALLFCCFVYWTETSLFLHDILTVSRRLHRSNAESFYFSNYPGALVHLRRPNPRLNCLIILSVI